MINHSGLFKAFTGTGKSVLLRHIVESLRRKGRQVAVTASTGVAAVNIGGTTIHAFAGKFPVSIGYYAVLTHLIGIGHSRLSSDGLIKRVLGNKKNLNRLKSARVLVIDESQCFAFWFF
jgi:ATP-dependent DNA helicase PIF1